MMKKLIILLVAVILPIGLFAQTQKFAHVDASEIIPLMPEVAGIQKQLNDLNEQYEREFTQLQTEYNNKYEAYMAEQETLTENIKLRRMQEMQEMGERMENFIPIAREDVAKKQQELFAPVQEKMMKAIQQVGDEQGYTYIFIYDPQLMMYVGNSAVDATPQVKAKLGL